MKDEHFNRVMSETESNAWQTFKFLVSNFLGKKECSEYVLQ